jgi:hypothetical protein
VDVLGDDLVLDGAGDGVQRPEYQTVSPIHLQTRLNVRLSKSSGPGASVTRTSPDHGCCDASYT